MAWLAASHIQGAADERRSENQALGTRASRQHVGYGRRISSAGQSRQDGHTSAGDGRLSGVETGIIMQNNLVETLIGAIVVAVAAVFLFFAYTTTGSGSVSGYDIAARFSSADGI